MTEVLQNMQHVYDKWEKSGPSIASTPSFNPISQKTETPGSYSRVVSSGKQAWRDKFGNNVKPPQYRRSRSRNNASNSAQHSVGYLAQFKTTPLVTADSLRSRRPFMGRCCTCMPNSRTQLFEENETAFDEIQDIFRIETKTKNNPLFVRMFSHVVYAFRRDVTHKYPNVSIAVMISPRLNEAVQKTILQEKTEGKTVSESSLKKKAKAMVHRMKATISNNLIRFTGWFLHKFLGRILLSIQVHKGQLQMLKLATKRELPVIFLPSHRSHLDYILLTFLLWNHDMRAPHVAAGDNLIIPFFSALMRGLGGFFIRRKLDKSGKKDHMYRAVLHTYMQELLRRNQHFEFFIEGGRTRTGKTYSPKGGLLSVVVDAYLSGVIPDAYIVPVSISYERIIEGSFKNELMGKPKKQESFWRAWLEIWKVFYSEFGNVRVDFCQPFSLKEHLQVASGFELQRSTSFNSSVGGSVTSDGPLTPVDRPVYTSSLSISSNSGLDIGGEDTRASVQCLADHVIYNSGRCQAVMSTHFLAFLMLHKFRQGANMHQLLKACDWLRNELYLRGRDVGFSGKPEDMINHACLVLGDHLISKLPQSCQNKSKLKISDNNNMGNQFFKPTLALPDVFELAYYANTVTMTFCLESALATALYSMIGHDLLLVPSSPNPTVVSQQDLLRRASDICTLLQYEFTFKPPCVSLEEALEGAVEELLASDIISLQESDTSSAVDMGSVSEKAWASHFASSLSWGNEDDSEEEWEDYRVPDKMLQVNFNGSLERFKLLLNVLGPYTEAYHYVTCNLVLLTEQKMSENEFLKTVHSSLVERAQTGLAVYVESSSIETAKNAVKSLKHIKVIRVTDKNLLELTTEYQNEENLTELIEMMQGYKP